MGDPVSTNIADTITTRPKSEGYKRVRCLPLLFRYLRDRLSIPIAEMTAIKVEIRVQIKFGSKTGDGK